MNYIKKTFKMCILEYTDSVREIFEMARLLHPTCRKNDKYYESDWDTRDTPYNEDVVRKEFKGGLTAVMQEEAEEKFGDDYRTIPPNECIDMIGNLEARYDRRCAARESQKPVTKKKKA